MTTKECLGYVKYSGDSTKNGVIDARDAAKALTGFDNAVRHFVAQQKAPFGLDFSIPVRIEEGSWVASIPQDIENYLKIAGIAVLATYGSSAAKKIAENDFKDVSTKVILTKALQAIQWTIKIGKHLHSVAIKKVSGMKWKGEDTVLLPDSTGRYLEVPVSFFQMYLECPSSLLSDLVALVGTERQLAVGAQIGDILEEEVVTSNERSIFTIDDTLDEEELFPELTHGMAVVLEGVVTRGNEVTNSVGFRYQEHILNCEPRSGSIVRFKKHLFLPCKINGQISRADEKGRIVEKKPTIIFEKLTIIGDAQADLFGAEDP